MSPVLSRPLLLSVDLFFLFAFAVFFVFTFLGILALCVEFNLSIIDAVCTLFGECHDCHAWLHDSTRFTKPAVVSREPARNSSPSPLEKCYRRCLHVKR